MKIRFQNPLSRFIAAFLGLLGFVTACTSADLYGSPYASYKINGTVTDVDHNPIPNAQVTAKDLYGRNSDSKMSASDGTFELRDGNYDGGRKIAIVTTCDGYEKDSTVIELEFSATKKQKKKNEFYEGNCNYTFDPVLKKMEASDNTTENTTEK